VINTFFLKSNPEDIGLLPWGETSRSIESYSPRPFIHYRDVFKDGHFWLIGISYLFISTGSYIITDLIVTYGVMELKINYSIASTFITIMAVSGIVGGIVLMSLSDYIGRKKSLIIIHSLVTLSILLLILVGNDILLLNIGMGFFGFFYSAIWPMYSACARDYFPKEVVGSIIGLLTIFYGTGAMVGPIVAGYLADVTGTFRWSFGVGAFTSAIAALLIGSLRKPKEI
jgi:MFS family permease